MRHTSLGFAAAAAALTLTLAGCATSAEPSGNDEDRTFVYLADIEPTCYDTGSFRNLSNYNIASQILDPLVSQAPDGSFHPGLASSWESSEDGLVWTFTLRDDVTFHDGEALTAAAVDASVLRAIALRPVTWWDSSRVVDDLTWELTLTQPYAPLLQAFANPNFPILSLASLDEYTDADRCSNPAALVGTGAFVPSEFTPGSSLVLTRNDDYEWGPEFRENQGPAYVKSVEIRFISEASSRVGTLLSGQADAAASIPTTDLQDVLDTDGFTSTSAPSAGIPFTAVLNTVSGPTADILVRQALRASLDLDTIVDTIYGGVYDRAWTALVPVTAPAGSYNEALEGSWSYDPDEAIALLEQAGYDEVDADGYRTKDGERLTLDWIVDSSDVRDQRDLVIQAIQADARKVGIEINIEQLDSNSYGERGGDGEYSIVAESWTQADAYLLGNSVLSSQTPPNGLNYARLSVPEYDELATEAVESSDDERRAELYREIQQIHVDNAFTIPIYIQDYLVATSDAVEGITFHPAGWPNTFSEVRFVD